MRKLFFVLVFVATGHAQDTLNLNEVVIKSPLILSEECSLPISINSWSANGHFRSIEQELNSVSGVWLTNTSNAAQDYRISIRGFGSRASFGVRGIRILLDDIPQTTPDGQSQIDHLPLHLIQQTEVVRGPAGSRHGNAAGGVLSFFTSDPNSYKASIRLQRGSFGLLYSDATINQNLSYRSSIIGSFNYQKTDGFRNHAGFENKSAFVKLNLQKNKAAHTISILHFDSPYAFDPGGLTINEVSVGRSQARKKNETYEAGESVRQSQMAWKYKTPFQGGELESILHYSPRLFDGKLPFENGGLVNLNRDFYGGTILYRFPSDIGYSEGIIGLDFQNQRDHRKRYANLAGTKGNQTMNQIEHFNAASAFGIWSIVVGKSIFDFSLRYDSNLVTLDDRFQNSEEKYHRQFRQWSPHVGFLWKINQSSTWFLSLGSGFEVPALSELSANPYSRGFNPDLKPMVFNGLDFGFRQKKTSLRWEAVAFYTAARNELIRYELEDYPSQNFYKNLGESTRFGIEVEASLYAYKNHLLQGGLSVASFRFDDGGTEKTLPGVPSNTANLRWIYNNNGWKVLIDGHFVGEYFANNSNTVGIDPYSLAHLEIHKQFYLGSAFVELGCSVFNLTDTYYFDNIRINAFGGRFYEPAVGRHVLFSLKTVFE